MKLSWTVEELEQHFTLQADEREFLGLNKPHNQLGKAILLKVFQYEGRFPQEKLEVPEVIIEFVARQLYVLPEVWLDYQWNESRMREHRQQVREWLGFRRASVADQKVVSDWIIEEILPEEFRPSHLREMVYQYLYQHQLESPSEDQIERLINSALHHQR
jgi:hypothetical protein